MFNFIVPENYSDLLIGMHFEIVPVSYLHHEIQCSFFFSILNSQFLLAKDTLEVQVGTSFTIALNYAITNDST